MQLLPKTFYEHMSTNTSIYISNQQEETKPGPDLAAEQKPGPVYPFWTM
jgi:hypothetical protein